MHISPSRGEPLPNLNLPFKWILSRFKIFWCLEWECCTFQKIDEKSFKPTNTILWLSGTTLHTGVSGFILWSNLFFIYFSYFPFFAWVHLHSFFFCLFSSSLIVVSSSIFLSFCIFTFPLSFCWFSFLFCFSFIQRVWSEELSLIKIMSKSVSQKLWMCITHVFIISGIHTICQNAYNMNFILP